MEFDEAKEILKNGYLKAGFELIEDHPRYFDMCVCVTLDLEDLEEYFEENQYLRITEEDIMEYVNSEAVRATLETVPVECSICGPTYREQIIQPLRTFETVPLGPHPYIVFGNPNSGQLYVEINTASMLFVNYFRFYEAYLQQCKDIFATSKSKPLDIREWLYRPTTIRIGNMSEVNTENALTRSSILIESCLFEFSYLKHIPMRLAEEWPYKKEKPKLFEFDKPVSESQFPLPRVSYNTDLIRFYQLGRSSDILVLQFLAFYQVLEYFFIKVSNEKLYDQLSRRLNDPKFKTTPDHLDHLIQDVIEHRRITDETEMLKNVINKFIDEKELIKFIQMYEDHLGEELYTKRRDLFGEKVHVPLRSGHVVGNIAKTIKVVRNALVHSSDRHERFPRHVPFSESTKIVEYEIPLVKFLAEKVIIASAKPREDSA